MLMLTFELRIIIIKMLMAGTEGFEPDIINRIIDI